MFWFYQVKTALPFGGASFFAITNTNGERSFDQTIENTSTFIRY